MQITGASRRSESAGVLHAVRFVRPEKGVHKRAHASTALAGKHQHDLPSLETVHGGTNRVFGRRRNTSHSPHALQ